MFNTEFLIRFLIGAGIGAMICISIHLIITAINKRGSNGRRPIKPMTIMVYIQARRERKIKKQLGELLIEYIDNHPDIKTIKLADLGYHTEIDDLGVHHLEENYITIVD